MEGRTYRYFGGQPLYAFGHGLSYTEFTYSGLALSGGSSVSDAALQASVTVTNTGARAGDEVVQFYVADVEASVPTPLRQLAGFARVTLQPGETQCVTVSISPALLQIVTDDGRCVLEPGAFRLTAGGRQPCPDDDPDAQHGSVVGTTFLIA
jgi:beta-glucosidase